MPEMEGKTIHSVAKAIRLLDIFTKQARPLTLTDLYRQTNWPKSTIHGLLTTMRASGVVEQQADGRYWLGLRLFEYGCAVSGAWDIRAIAEEPMKTVCAQTGESVFLSVLDRGAVVTLAEEESRASVRVVSEVGARLPIHCTSQGKLFLAHLSAAESKRILRTSELTGFTQKTLTQAEQFGAELEKIRTQGYALENGEFKRGLRSVSVPVRQADGKVQYALGCVGLLPQEEISSAVYHLMQAASQIGRAIGYRG